MYQIQFQYQCKYKIVIAWLIINIVVGCQCDSLEVKRPFSCSADKFADGCSVPVGFLAPFRKEFTPACNRHDICYGCGHHYNWTRSDCDNAFYKNMKIICEHLRTKRSLMAYLNDIWVSFKRGSTKSQCLTAAKMYYEGVHLFAESHFETNEHDYCLSQCADEHGSPGNNVTIT